jgi:hypothetical protein
MESVHGAVGATSTRNDISSLIQEKVSTNTMSGVNRDTARISAQYARMLLPVWTAPVRLEK